MTKTPAVQPSQDLTGHVSNTPLLTAGASFNHAYTNTRVEYIEHLARTKCNGSVEEAERVTRKAEIELYFSLNEKFDVLYAIPKENTREVV